MMATARTLCGRSSGCMAESSYEIEGVRVESNQQSRNHVLFSLKFAQHLELIPGQFSIQRV
jgi:hypothetical protein